MPMPSVYAVGAAASSTGAAITPGIPAGTVADDVCILLHELDPVLHSAALGAVTGYAEVNLSPSSQTGGLPTRLTVRWHRATGPESGTVSCPAVTNHHSARIIGIRGVKTTGNPWDVTAAALGSDTTTAVSIDGLTTTQPDCLILAAFTTGTDVASTTHVSAWANASLANPAVAEQVDNWISSGTGGGIGAATGGKAAAGVVNPTTATLVTGNFKALFCMALPGAAAPSGPHPAQRQQRRSFIPIDHSFRFRRDPKTRIFVPSGKVA
jgi:hypothetical protein